MDSSSQLPFILTSLCATICLVKLNSFYKRRLFFRISLEKIIFKNQGGLTKMKLENKKLVRLIAEQYARINDLEEQLELAESAVRALASGGNLPKVKR